MICNSFGAFSGIMKKLAAAAFTALLLAGCDSGVSEGSNQGSDNTHTVSENTSSESYQQSSSDISEASYVSAVSTADDLSNSSDSSESSQSFEDISSTEVSGGHDSFISGTTSNSGSNSESRPPVSSSAESKPPVEVVVPNIVMPTSPGTNAEIKDCGIIDYSNTSKGYISAKYTGSKKKVKLRMEANGETYTHDLNVNGKIEYFPLSCGNGTYKITLFEQVEGTSYAKGMELSINVNMPDPTAPFSLPNKYVNYSQSSKAVYKAAELCAGKSGNIEKIAAVFTWITENISYDNQLAATVKSGYVPDVDSTLARKKGICYDYSALMAAMLRSQGIPTRMVHGYAYSSPNDIYHAWNEVYTKETGWITPELLLKNNGYNLVDATFYAGSSNKGQISAYISTPGNYSAVYYY